MQGHNLIVNLLQNLLSTLTPSTDTMNIADTINLGYSTKNIPIPGKNEYLQKLIQKTEKFIRNIRWKTYFFLKPKEKPKQKKTYGFPSTKTAPKIPELTMLEDEMLKMIQNIKFRRPNSQFQYQLATDVHKIMNSKELLVPADKTTNYYKINADAYEKLLLKISPKTTKKHQLQWKTK